MEFTEEEKVELIKRIIIKRLENINKLSVLITQLKNLSWTKIKNLLDTDWLAETDVCDINSQKSLNRKAKILALKEEKDTF